MFFPFPACSSEATRLLVTGATLAVQSDVELYEQAEDRKTWHDIAAAMWSGEAEESSNIVDDRGTRL